MIAEPFRLTIWKVKFLWDAERQLAFDKIKVLMPFAPLLQRPDLTKSFVLSCDTSNTSLGCLTKEIYGKERVFEFASSVLSDSSAEKLQRH